MSGIVYLLTNPAMPGLVKIGKTTRDDPQLRMGDLYTSGVPLPFDCELAVQVEDESAVEAALHQAFEPDRVNPRREFFKIDISQAEALLRLLGTADVTPEITEQNDADSESKSAAEQYKKRRPPLNFIEMGIEPGSVLHFTRGEETVTTIDGRRVMHNGEETSLSLLTGQLLDSKWYVAPTPHWRYDGRLLREIYNDTYPQEA
ncbi:MAG: GIY-YIG nuclease family protein [Parvibaculales bacterium]